ncbi:beta-ketoacyl synthase N-terminal-like domain-containing protein [Streptomyces sp. JHA26]|uniref:beta-ketoacyl synthase N-terminal-like domain-containing protein n=1 Tax=Streptomyces sp. JHA26 TaxID=1917143 RepID=UPI001C0D111F|nr:beta-ketoacyl synthase N-terminal-like domain-containing protein [Streptomyces sp. JHA26]
MVISGVGVLCAVADDAAAFAAALREGRCGIRQGADGGPGRADLDDEAPERALEALRGSPGLPVDRALRAAGRAGLAMRAAVAAALQAWDDARLTEQPPEPDRVALVVAGNNLTGRQLAELTARYAHKPRFVPPRSALRLQDTDQVGVLSEVLGVEGEGCTVGAASASGNLALVQGTRLVASGAADACLVVGAPADLSDVERQAYLNIGAMAPGPAAPPFDPDHSGFVAGRAAACAVLESESSARRRRVPGYARVDGAHARLAATSSAAPDPRAEAAAMTGALRDAGVRPDQVTYVNTHGTGSPGGDAAELAAMGEVFGHTGRRPWANATKALTGHCLTAAGVVEAVAVAVQMRGGFLHPTPGRPPKDARGVEFTTDAAVPADISHALSNGFGFGGFNSSILLSALPRTQR